MMTKNNWFEIWYEDKTSILTTMLRNMNADIEAGYNPMGHCIRKQMVDIEEYREQIDRQMQNFRTMAEPRIQHWCYYDLKRRGAI